MKADKNGIYISVKELDENLIVNPKNELQEGWNMVLQSLKNHCQLGEPMTFNQFKVFLEKLK